MTAVMASAVAGCNRTVSAVLAELIRRCSLSPHTHTRIIFLTPIEIPSHFTYDNIRHKREMGLEVQR